MATSHTDLSHPDALTPSPGRAGAMTTAEQSFPLPAGYGMTPSPANDLLYGGFNQTWLVNGLRRRWLTALLLGSLVATLVAIALWFLFPASSRTTAYLMMQFGDSNNPFEKQVRLNSEQLKQEQFAQLTLVKSSLVLQQAFAPKSMTELAAVQQNQPDPVQWMLEELKVSFPNSGNVMEVRYDGSEDAKEMELVVQAIVDAYYEEVVIKERIERLRSYDDLAQVQRDLQKRLSDKMSQLKRKIDVAQGGDSSTAEIEQMQLMRTIDFVRAELARVDKELLNNEVMKEIAVREANSQAAVEAAVSETMDRDPMIVDYRKQLFEIDRMIMARQAQEKRKNSPAVQQLQQSREQIAMMEEQYRTKAERELREKYARMPNIGFQSAMVQYKAVVERLGVQKQELEEKLRTSEETLMTLGSRDPAIEILKNEIANDQEVVKELEFRLQQLNIEQRAREAAAGDANRHEKVRVMQKAMAQPNINTYERIAIVAVGALAGLALTCYGVALTDFRKRRLNGPSDVDEGLGIRVLGVLPATTARKSLAGGNLVSAQVAESVDSVRATLMHASTKMRRQIILVTSPETMEGATTVAANLALSLARAGRRTLLVDSDLRAPSLHALFGLPLDGGFSEVLRSEIDLSDAVRPTQTESLYLLTAGVVDSQAVHNLATDQLEPIVDQLRTQFDFIIIDGPPILQVADGLALGRLVDSAILTVLRDHSELPKIHKAAELLDNLGIRLLGAVINGVPVRADRRLIRMQQANVKKALPSKAAKPAKDKGKSAKIAEAPAPAASTVVDAVPEDLGATSDSLDLNLDEFDIDLDDK
ncbi:MAG: polysaccharide biosynthesis tyrosine autokinase [Pirellulales bacterium]|nr:polysaccharide biosynthesis tyrosine autokinase [Pirellulales bacterium]